MEQVATAIRRQIEGVLTAKQQAEYKHDVRCEVALSLGVGYWAKNLGIDLSERQKRQLVRLWEEGRENYRKRFVSTGDRLLAVLTPRQREKLLARFSDDVVVAPVVHVPRVENGELRLEFAPGQRSPEPLVFSFASDSGWAWVGAYPHLTISDPAIRKELALTAEQEAELRAIKAKSQAAAQKVFARFEAAATAPKPPPETLKPWRAEYHRALELFGKEVVRQIEAMLQPQQAAALKAICRKHGTIETLMLPHWAALDDLHATAEQRAKLRQISDESTAPDWSFQAAAGEKALGILAPSSERSWTSRWSGMAPYDPGD